MSVLAVLAPLKTLTSGGMPVFGPVTRSSTPPPVTSPAATRSRPATQIAALAPAVEEGHAHRLVHVAVAVHRHHLDDRLAVLVEAGNELAAVGKRVARRSAADHVRDGEEEIDVVAVARMSPGVIG